MVGVANHKLLDNNKQHPPMIAMVSRTYLKAKISIVEKTKRQQARSLHAFIHDHVVSCREKRPSRSFSFSLMIFRTEPCPPLNCYVYLPHLSELALRMKVQSCSTTTRTIRPA